MKAIIEKLESLDARQVYDVAFELKDKFDEYSSAVFESALEVLERKLTEDKYIQALETL